jgi:alpha-galactosidase
MKLIAELRVDLKQGKVYEHGWQSWSPSTAYPVTGRGHRPSSAQAQLMGYRPDLALSPVGFQGEGLLAVAPAPGEAVRIFSARSPEVIPSITAKLRGEVLLIRSDQPGQVLDQELQGPLTDALGRWADGFAGAQQIRRAPTVWCSWYHYYSTVTEADILENLDAIGRHDLPIDVVQVDDGWQAELGDWSSPSDRFESPADIAARIRAAGRRPGIWLAPFLAGSRSELARRHPDWILRGLGPGWHQDVYALDLTQPGFRAYLTEVLGRLAADFDYVKADFLFAGALSGTTAYRDGLELIREAIGPDTYLLGCGAPILPSVGLVDAMRVAPDIAPQYEPLVDDLSSYSQRAAALTTAGRSWQHGRFWVNDPDCLIARPQIERREDWAEVIRRCGGLRASSDRIASLDEWGLATTRELLSQVPPPEPFDHRAPSGTGHFDHGAMV